jgi:hypothetical protein
MANDQVPIDREHLDAMADLLAGGHEHDESIRQQAYEAGERAATNGYRAGHDLGFDTGYSARQDTRAYVHGILDGFAAGNEARKQVVRELLDSHRPQQPQHEAPELEAEL